MRQLYPDLWQTDAEQPYETIPDLVTRACLLKTDAGNLLIYNTGLEHELAGLSDLGGVKRHYLSHIDEAGPSVARVRELYGAELWCHAAEADDVTEQSGVRPNATFDSEETHLDCLEILPRPGHTIGSTCFLYKSPHGKTYLFTGDTFGMDAEGKWVAGYIPGMSDKAALLETLDKLRRSQPDVVISSAFGRRYPVNEVTPESWRAGLETARAALEAA